jgi:4-phytase/acid phosphatase
MIRYIRLAAWSLALSTAACAQSVPDPAAAPRTTPAAELQYVVYLSRHGVRSPTGKSAQYNQFSTGAWPEWSVQPGYLTPHGFQLMQLFGAYDRTQLAAQGLLHPTGCADAAHITVYADSDQRTRETAKALAQGMMPGCDLPIAGLPEGTNDPLFHPVPSLIDRLDPALATAALAGRIGGAPANITAAYRDQIAALDRILATCGTAPATRSARTSLFDIPATLAPGTGDHLADLKGPINTASTLAENLLLEYTEGMPAASVGWGCVHRAEIQSLVAIHTAATDITQRTLEIARPQASNLLDQVRLSIQQATEAKPIPGALGKPTDRALVLVGHDTNIENIAGTLGLDWILDGRRDDTPPGGALLFEVWRTPSTGQSTVRVFYTAQTLDQMRDATPLTPANPPGRVPLFVPGCSRTDLSCTLPAFESLLRSATAPR